MEQTSIIEQPGAAIVALRREMGLSQTQFGAEIGLSSKSKVSEIESSGRASLPVALKIEELSAVGGAPRIDAALLNDDVARARAACAGGCGTVEPVAECQAGDAVSCHGDADSAPDASASTGQFGDLSRRDGAQEMSRDPSARSAQKVVA